MKIIPFFPDDPVDTGIFCKCVRYLVAAYFRIIPAFEIFFIIISDIFIIYKFFQHLFKHMLEKIGVISVFGPVIAVLLLALILPVWNQHKSLF